MEGLAASIHLLEFKHFIFPFLAHALGTLVGAFIISKIAASHHIKLALLVGAFFLLGGIQMALSLNAPLWFEIVDLALAYIPMAFLGWKIAGSPSHQIS